jgi:holo-[acyl-carrier-protein] synthase
VEDLKGKNILGIGVDIVELARIRRIRFLSRFAEYFLTPRELEHLHSAPDPEEFVASRFAVKEAVIKAFPRFLRPHDFEIVKEGKKPTVHFSEPSLEDQYKALASITHSYEYAAGYAIVIKR